MIHTDISFFCFNSICWTILFHRHFFLYRQNIGYDITVASGDADAIAARVFSISNVNDTWIYAQ